MAALRAVYAAADADLIYASAADDFISNPRFFALAVNALTNRPAAGYFARASGVDPETLKEKWVMGNAPQEGFIPPDEAFKAFLHSEIFVPGVSAVWRSDLLEQAGGFDTALGPQVDYFVNHALPAMAGVIFSTEIVAVSRFIPNSYSGAATDDQFFRRYALVERKLKALSLPHAYDPAWFGTWRRHVINGRLAVARQKGFLEHIRSQMAEIPPQERALLDPAFFAAYDRLLKQMEQLDRDLDQRFAQANAVFDAEAA
jgi:hypothetical protein